MSHHNPYQWWNESPYSTLQQPQPGANFSRSFHSPAAENNASQFTTLHPASQEYKTPNTRASADDTIHVQKRPTISPFLVQWTTELVALLVSVGLFAAVVGVLVSIDETPLSRWQMPWSIQPTTLIAILVNLCRLFLLAVVAEALSQLKWIYFEGQPRALEDIEHFDSASRGAFGAILFIGKLRWRAVVGCVGALVMILALAMEPFAQQSLSFYNKSHTTDQGNAFIPRASDFDLDTTYQVSPYSGTLNQMGGLSRYCSVASLGGRQR